VQQMNDRKMSILSGLPQFIKKFPRISVTDKASAFKIGKTLGFTKVHHEIPRRRKVGVAIA